MSFSLSCLRACRLHLFKKNYRFSRFQTNHRKKHFTCHPPTAKPTPRISPSYRSLPATHFQSTSPRSLRQREISRPRNLRRSCHPTYQISRPHFVHYVPFEILALIFTLGAQDDNQLPITVSHVCRQWREVALRTPSLWRRVSLSPHERLWRERIDRARACTLDVELFPWRESSGSDRRSQDLNAYTVQWYMYLVLPFIYRWRSLDIVFTDYQPYLWRGALAGCGSPAPALEELSLVYRLNDNVEEFLLFSEHAPRLRKLTIDGIRLVWSRQMFGNLTCLDYTHHGFTSGHRAVDDVISILSVSNRLVELRLLFPRGHYAVLPSRRDYVNKRVRLRQLQHLQLAVDGSDIPFELAYLVTLISAHHLLFVRLIDLGQSHHPFPSIKSFFYVFPIPRSLQTIDIGHGWYDSRMVQPLSQSLPNLSKIVVKRTRLPDQVLELNTRLHETGFVAQTQGGHHQVNHANYHFGTVMSH